MNSKASSALLIAAFVLCCSTASAFNITRLLEQYPDFSTFNELLNQTKVYEQINRRQTITVLALDNSATGGIAGKPLDVLKGILSAHVILDYYDMSKLEDLSKKSTLLTTLYQTTGVANNQQGFLNVSKLSNGDIVFGSAVKGSGLVAKLLKPVAAQPYNISVLQVSAPIIAPGIDAANPNGTKAPPPPPSSLSPAAAPPKKTPAATPDASPSEAPVADSPASSEAPADAPASADGPADAPASSSPSPTANADAPSADADTPTADEKSSSSRLVSNIGVVAVMALLSKIMA